MGESGQERRGKEEEKGSSHGGTSLIALLCTFYRIHLYIFFQVTLGKMKAPKEAVRYAQLSYIQVSSLTVYVLKTVFNKHMQERIRTGS